MGNKKPSRLKKVVEKGYNIQHMHLMYIFNSMKNMFGEQIPSSQGLYITWLKDNLPYVYLIMVAVYINFLNVLWLKYHFFNIKKHNDRNLTNTAVRIPCHYCFSYKEHCNIFQVFVNITLSGPFHLYVCIGYQFYKRHKDKRNARWTV